MAVQQSSFYCPVCQQQRLFTRQGMNHTPHILASVFLCGLWLPVWAIITATYDARFHCTLCGYSDAVHYLANPYLRQQTMNQASAGDRSTAFLRSSYERFAGLGNTSKVVVIGFVVVLMAIVIKVVITMPITNEQIAKYNEEVDRHNQSILSEKTTLVEKSNPEAVSNTAQTSSPLPSSLSPKDNLELGVNALSQSDLSTARSHLSAISKGSPEYARAKKALAEVEARDKKAKIYAELRDLTTQAAQQDKLMNETEHMLDGEGTVGKTVYLNAFKRRAQIQLQRLELERKLKRMP